MRVKAVATGFGGISLTVECGESFALDAGVEPEADKVVLTHAHLDHSLMAPGREVYATLPTLALVRELWTDAKSLNPDLPWSNEDVQRTLSNSKRFPYGKPFKIGKATLTFYNAGHILGSSMVLVECEGTRLLYTGDLGTTSFLLDHWIKEVPKADILITESSYLCKDRPSAKKEWAKLLNFLKFKLKEGPVLIAANAVGKVQEVVKFLMNYRNSLPLRKVFVEGMGWKATKIYDEMIEYLKESEVVSWLNGSRTKLTEFAENPKSLGERRDWSLPGTAIVAPSGSLSGGMSVWWALRGVPYVLLGHVFEPASKLLGGEEVELEDPLGNVGTVRPPDLHLEISRHASKQELYQLFSLSGAEEIYLVHGDDECRKAMEEQGFKVLWDGDELTFSRGPLSRGARVPS